MLASLTIGLTLVLGAPIPKKKESKELQLDGKWNVVSIEGKTKPTRETIQYLYFEKNTFKYVFPNDDKSSSNDHVYRINYETTPFQIDLHFIATLLNTKTKVISDKAVYVGIIEVVGDNMKLRLSSFDSSDRPLSFEGNDKSPVFILKRDKGTLKN